MKINEKELKRIFQNIKNERIFEEFYTKYNKLVYGISFSILKNKEDSEDVTQKVFTKIYELDAEKIPTKNEASWLYAVTKNEAISTYKKKNNNLGLDEIYEIEDKNNDLDELIDKVEFNKLISKLNKKEKEIVSLKILSELSFEQIGKLINEPIGTVKWRYYKAIHSLKMILSNLAMFIITFIFGIKSLRKEKESLIQTEIKNEEKNVTITDSIEQGIKDENTFDSTIVNDDLEDNKSMNSANIVENTTNEAVVQEIKEENRNLNVGILSISLVFLVLTIIFSTFFKKYQLKLTKKKSK